MLNVFFTLFLLCASSVYADVNAEDIEYFLWNRHVTREQLRTNEYGNNIYKNAPVKIMIHDWEDNINSFWYPGVRDAYIETGANVIAIDWSIHAQLIYLTAASRLPDIGVHIADFIAGLVNSEGILIDSVHLIGHGLGAHLSGFTGKSLQSLHGMTLGRISGLDPARANFTYSLDRNRLERRDANRVDTILTDAGLIGYGINRALGHVNFWPNGGTAIQPGCDYPLCSHNRAPRFFTEGITSRRFVSRQCDSYRNYNLGFCRNSPQNLLGEFTNFNVHGDYFYLSTNSSPPYALG